MYRFQMHVRLDFRFAGTIVLQECTVQFEMM